MSEYINVSNFSYLLHPYKAVLLTCCDTEGKPNIITIAWVIPISMKPPLIGVSIKPSHFSYNLIKSTAEFVINITPYELAWEALYCGSNSGRQVNKFEFTGLTSLPAKKVRSPIIQECLAHLECQLKEEIEIGDHNFLIAEVVAAYTQSNTIDDDNLYDLDNVHLLLHLGKDRFTST
jgi:flavin reductase (DIM6/NTAB) family NADH-FMN oxidoreductase RutF